MDLKTLNYAASFMKQRCFMLMWRCAFVYRVSRGKIQTHVLHERHRWNWLLIERRVCQNAKVSVAVLFFCCCGCTESFLTPLIICRSFIELSNGALSKKQAEDGIKAMMQAAGFDNKEQISWADFHFLLKDHEKELQFAQLNVKGWEKFSSGNFIIYFLLTLVIRVCVCMQEWRNRKRNV